LINQFIIIMQTICPVPTQLQTVQNPGCPENIGQIQKIIFQRASANWVFDSTAGKDINLLASWTPLLTAVDNTKIVIAPNCNSVVITPPTAITTGGNDNSTLNGRKLNTGFSSVDLTGMFRSMPSEIIAQLKLLQYGEDLVWYGVNQFGQIVARDIYPGHPGTNVVGIPLFSPFFGDAGNEGYAKDDMANFSFVMDYDWRSQIIQNSAGVITSQYQLILVKPTGFNALTQLKAIQET
jgi:hypothetical protein